MDVIVSGTRTSLEGAADGLLQQGCMQQPYVAVLKQFMGSVRQPLDGCLTGACCRMLARGAA